MASLFVELEQRIADNVVTAEITLMSNIMLSTHLVSQKRGKYMYIVSVSHHALLWGPDIRSLLSVMWHCLGALLPSIHIPHGRPGTSSMQLCKQRGFSAKVR